MLNPLLRGNCSFFSPFIILQSYEEQLRDQQSLYDQMSKEQEASRERLYSINNDQKQELNKLQVNYDTCEERLQQLEREVASRDEVISNDKVRHLP